MSKTIEITLDDHCASFLSKESLKGKSANEVVHQAIKLFEKKQAEEVLIEELQKGMDSGFVENWSFDEWIKHKNAQHSA